ncbi:energy transducer TonB [Melittangium boletus]|uniref:energy transducer TonB n=1 Tax=Melittangium boletus TaxID=83453 RepID=UPI003DA482ED
MPPSSHRLPRALLLSVGLHLGLGVWLWSRSEPEPPAVEPLQRPTPLQFVEVELPLPLHPAPPSVVPGSTQPIRAPAPKVTRRLSKPLSNAAKAPDVEDASGGLHPTFFTLGRSMLQHWNPAPYLAAIGFEGTFATSVGAQHEVGRIVAAADARDRKALRRETKQALRTTRHTRMHIFQDARGQVLGVRVVASSHDPRLDIVAVQALLDAARSQRLLAPDPPRQEGALVRSLWEAELTVAESPPAREGGLEFSAEVKPTTLQLPPGQHLYKRVRLLEVR